MSSSNFPAGLKNALDFGLIEALLGRRSRRFLMGATIPDGPLAYTSRQQPTPLTEQEKMLVLAAVAGNTGGHNAIMYNARYAPHLPNYAAAAGGRTFPSAAGFHTSEIFFTDDDGVYFLATRDAENLLERMPGEDLYQEKYIETLQGRIRKLADGRLYLPPVDPHIEGHNTWVVNRPGSLLVIPAADVAQHNIANLCYYLQNGFCIYDDVHGENIKGLERFSRLYDPNSLLPLSVVEQYSLMECTTEIATSCYAGMLMLQAVGLGGWMFNGMSPYSVMGASGDPDVPGLGFRYDSDERWVLPNPTGLPGVFEGFCPPHYPDMRSAVEAFCQRKFGPGGPFHPDTPGPWKDSPKVRGSAQVHSEEFRECVALQAQHIFNRFGKFPGTAPSILVFAYLQAHHLDLEFYDRHFKPGAYLETHARHMERWHPDKPK